MDSISQLLFDPTAYRVAKGLDFWLGVIGFLISMATFGLGWIKLARVEASARAAARAVAEVKVRVRRYDATLDTADGIHALDEINRFLDASEWRSVVTAMSQVRRAIIRIDPSVSTIDETASKSLRRTSAKLDKQIGIIERAEASQTDFPDLYLIREIVRAGQDAFIKAQRALEDHVS